MNWWNYNGFQYLFQANLMLKSLEKYYEVSNIQKALKIALKENYNQCLSI